MTPIAMLMPFAMFTKLLVVCCFVHASTAFFMLFTRSVTGFEISFAAASVTPLIAFCIPFSAVATAQIASASKPTSISARSR